MEIKNDINSIVVDGEVNNDAVCYSYAGEKQFCIFTIVNKKWLVTEEDTAKRLSTTFNVVVYGRLAEICKERAVNGQYVRVVGEFRQNPDIDNYAIEADHIQFKEKQKESDYAENY